MARLVLVIGCKLRRALSIVSLSNTISDDVAVTEVLNQGDFMASDSFLPVASINSCSGTETVW